MEEDIWSHFGSRPRDQIEKRDGKVKRRLILDCKESGINDSADKGGRLVLPRISDAVDDALHLMHCGEGHEDSSLEWLVLDFTDWFFNIPLHPDERKHFAMSYKGTYIAYLTQAQGSRNAPLICGRVAALVARLTQAMFDDTQYRLQIYVDDPLICTYGTTEQRQMWMTITATGIRLAYKKAARGTDLIWIGAQLTAKHQGKRDACILVQAKPEIVSEVIAMTEEHRKHNLIARKALLTYIGKLNHIAGIVEQLRPFLTDLYGVVHCTEHTRAPTNCYWSRQWQHVTCWMTAFLAHEGAQLRRIYRVQAYFGKGYSY